MRVINRYLTHDFLIVFSMTLLVLTFVMCLGAVIKAIDLLSRGVSGWFILKVFASGIPFTLSFSIPISTLTAVLLMFGRLSSDGEITAMKACGLSMWQIVSSVILISVILSLVCLYINAELAPRSHFMQRQVFVDLGMEDPVNLLEEGRFVREFPGLMVYVGKKDRNKVWDIVVYELGRDGAMRRNIRAREGVIGSDPTNMVLTVDLTDVRIDEPDPAYPMDLSKAKYITAQSYPVRLDFSKVLRDGHITKKAVDMTFAEILAGIRDMHEAFPNLNPQDVAKQKMKMVLSANERVALSLACFAFTLFGIPLGIRAHRKESSVGIAISMAVVFVFYFFIILADSMVGHPEYRPDLFVWIPVLSAEIVGILLIQRAN